MLMLAWYFDVTMTSNSAAAPGRSDATQGVETVVMLLTLPLHVDVTMAVR